MKKLDLKELKNFKDNTCITIGFFDGCHLGHQKILKNLVLNAKDNNLKSLAITFDDSFLSVFKMTNPICSFEERIDCFNNYKIDYLLVLKASDDFINMSAFTFEKDVLDSLNCKTIICGNDFTYGKDKAGNLKHLKSIKKYKVIEISDVYDNGYKISSSYIRNLLKNGDIEKANKYLYKNISIESKVTKGFQNGTKIGIKTANLESNNLSLLLKYGVYFGYTFVDEKRYESLISVGLNPTIKENKTVKIETHILDFDGKLYDKTINVEFLKYHREQIKFESLEELKESINVDISEVKSFFNLQKVK